MTRDAEGRVIDLRSTDYFVRELVAAAARGAPRVFCELLLPYLRRVMAATALESERLPRWDRHFSFRIWQPTLHDLDDALLVGAAQALQTLARDQPDELKPFLDELAADPHDGAQWLLYEGLRGAAAAALADWAADLLLEGEHRLASGYTSASFWTTRQLLQAISPHVSDDRFQRLERAAMELAPN